MSNFTLDKWTAKSKLLSFLSRGNWSVLKDLYARIINSKLTLDGRGSQAFQMMEFSKGYWAGCNIHAKLKHGKQYK